MKPRRHDTNRPKRRLFRRFGRLVSRAGLAGGGAQSKEACRPPSTGSSSIDTKGGWHEITGIEWSVIQPLLPTKPRGVPRVGDRRVLNRIFWRLSTGSPLADIPERYGPCTTCHNRFVRWRKAGAWDRLFAAVSRANDDDLQTVDSSSIRVHQHAANGKKGGMGSRRWAP